MKLQNTTPSSELNTTVPAPVELSLEQLQDVAGGGSPKGGWGPVPDAAQAPSSEPPVPGTPKGGW